MAARAGAAHRVEADAPPALPSVGAAVRGGVQDFYFNSWRLVPANVVWAGAVIAVIALTGLWLAAITLLPLAAVPVAGIQRMAGRLARGEGVAFSDFIDGMRRFARPALTLGAGAMILAIVFSVNVGVGLQLGNPFGWFLSATALYADIGLAVFLVALWPILTDPAHDGRSVRRVLALAALVCLARLGRMTLLTLLLVAILILSTVVFPAVLLVSGAYVALVASRYVLPLADRLEGRWATDPT